MPDGAFRAVSVEHATLADEGDHRFKAFAGFQVGEDEGPTAALQLRIMGHHFERGADHRCEVDLIDDQEVGLGDAGAALARNLLTGGDICLLYTSDAADE